MGESFGSVTISTSYYDDLKQCERLWKGVESLEMQGIYCDYKVYFTTSEKLKATLIENKSIMESLRTTKEQLASCQSCEKSSLDLIEILREEIKELKERSEIDRLKQELSECTKECEFNKHIALLDRDQMIKYIDLIKAIVSTYRIFDFMKFRKLVNSGHNYLAAHEIVIKNKS